MQPVQCVQPSSAAILDSFCQADKSAKICVNDKSKQVSAFQLHGPLTRQQLLFLTGVGSGHTGHRSGMCISSREDDMPKTETAYHRADNICVPPTSAAPESHRTNKQPQRMSQEHAGRPIRPMADPKVIRRGDSSPPEPPKPPEQMPVAASQVARSHLGTHSILPLFMYSVKQGGHVHECSGMSSSGLPRAAASCEHN